VSREFFLSGFFHGSVSPKSLIIPIGLFQIFRKFAEIFAAQGAKANGKNLQSEQFSLFLLDTFGE